MSVHLTVFEIKDDKARRDIEYRTKEFVREGSELARSGLELFCKVVDSLYDEATLLQGSVKPWHVVVSVIAPRVYTQIESSLVLLEKGYPAGAASCLRSALEAAQLLSLVILDEQAAIDYLRKDERFRRGARAYKELQKKSLDCRVGDEHAAEWYDELSSIAHPSPDSVPTAHRLSEGSSEHVIMGPTYHPVEISRIISRMLDILVGAITSDLCFHRPLEAPEVSPELLREGELLLERCVAYIRELRKRWFSEVEKDVTLQRMMDNLSQTLEKLRAQDLSFTSNARVEGMNKDLRKLGGKEMSAKVKEFPGVALSRSDIEEGKVLYVRDEANAQYAWDAGIAIGRYLAELKKGRIIGNKCRKCHRTVVPPRNFCEWCFRPMDEWVYLEDTGTILSYSFCYVTWDVKRVEEPEISAIIEIDGASPGMGIMHRLGEVEPDEVKIGMRVEAVWKPPEEREGAITDIKYFKPMTEE